MFWRAVGIVEKFGRGREIVVWGTGADAEHVLGRLEGELDVSFFTSADYQENSRFHGKAVCGSRALRPEKHFVIIAAQTYHDEIIEELNKLGFREFEDYFNWYMCCGLLFPFDIEYHGIRIGKDSYFNFPSDRLNRHVESVGRFASIHNSVQLVSNQTMNMIPIAVRVSEYFSPENQNLFRSQFAEGRKKSKEKVKVGNDVWIGANVVINTSTALEIGDGAIIGTDSLVLENIPPYAVVVGIPAKVKKYRFTHEQIEILNRVRWWEWDSKTLGQNAELLIYPDKFFERFGSV